MSGRAWFSRSFECTASIARWWSQINGERQAPVAAVQHEQFGHAAAVGVEGATGMGERVPVGGGLGVEQHAVIAPHVGLAGVWTVLQGPAVTAWHRLQARLPASVRCSR